MTQTGKLRCFSIGTLLIFLCLAPSAHADKPNRVEMHGNQGCLLVFDMSEHSNPSEMFEYIREHSDDFVGEPNQNIVQWLANFPEYQGNVGSLIKRNCKTFTIDIG